MFKGFAGLLTNATGAQILGVGVPVILGLAFTTHTITYVTGRVHGYAKKEDEIAKAEKKMVPIEIKAGEKTDVAKTEFEEGANEREDKLDALEIERLVALAKEEGRLKGQSEVWLRQLDDTKTVEGSCLNDPAAWTVELRDGARARRAAVQEGTRGNRRLARSKAMQALE